MGPLEFLLRRKFLPIHSYAISSDIWYELKSLLDNNKNSKHQHRIFYSIQFNIFLSLLFFFQQ